MHSGDTWLKAGKQEEDPPKFSRVELREMPNRINNIQKPSVIGGTDTTIIQFEAKKENSSIEDITLDENTRSELTKAEGIHQDQEICSDLDDTRK